MYAFNILLCIFCLTAVLAQTREIPFQVKSGLFDHSQPETLGLISVYGTETVTIFRAQENTDKYSHGTVVLPFKGYLYAQWQSSALDEDASDTWVAYSKSADG